MKEIEPGESSPNPFRPPATHRCKAAHMIVIKKAEVKAVKTKEETELEEKSKQVIQKPFEEKTTILLQDTPRKLPPTPIFYL